MLLRNRFHTSEGMETYIDSIQYKNEWKPESEIYKKAYSRFYLAMKEASSDKLLMLLSDAHGLKLFSETFAGFFTCYDISGESNQPIFIWDIVESKIQSSDKLSEIAKLLGKSLEEMKKWNESIKRPYIQKEKSTQEKHQIINEILEYKDINRDEASKLLEEIKEQYTKSKNDCLTNIIQVMNQLSQPSHYPNYDLYYPSVCKLIAIMHPIFMGKVEKYTHIMPDYDASEDIVLPSDMRQLSNSIKQLPSNSTKFDLEYLQSHFFLDESDFYRLIEKPESVKIFIKIISELGYSSRPSHLGSDNAKLIIQHIDLFSSLEDKSDILKQIEKLKALKNETKVAEEARITKKQECVLLSITTDQPRWLKDYHRDYADLIRKYYDEGDYYNEAYNKLSTPECKNEYNKLLQSTASSFYWAIYNTTSLSKILNWFEQAEKIKKASMISSTSDLIYYIINYIDSDKKTIWDLLENKLQGYPEVMNEILFYCGFSDKELFKKYSDKVVKRKTIGEELFHSLSESCDEFKKTLDNAKQLNIDLFNIEIKGMSESIVNHAFYGKHSEKLNKARIVMDALSPIKPEVLFDLLLEGCSRNLDKPILEELIKLNKDRINSSVNRNIYHKHGLYGGAYFITTLTPIHSLVFDLYNYHTPANLPIDYKKTTETLSLLLSYGAKFTECDCDILLKLFKYITTTAAKPFLSLFLDSKDVKDDVKNKIREKITALDEQQKKDEQARWEKIRNQFFQNSHSSGSKDRSSETKSFFSIKDTSEKNQKALLEKKNKSDVINLIRKLIQDDDCELSTLTDSWHAFQFKKDKSYETLLQYENALSKVGIKVRVEKEYSSMGGLIQVPAQLDIRESLESIISKFSAYHALSQKTIT